MTHPSATTAHHSALNTAQRTRDLTALREGAPLDLIVIGGGITGGLAGCLPGAKKAAK